MRFAMAGAMPLVMLLLAGPLAAQRPRGLGDSPPNKDAPSVTVIGGLAPYDFVDTGTGVFGGISASIPTSRIIVIEPGLTFLHYKNDLDASITYVLPEVSFQAQAPLRAVKPYVGAGLGFSEFLSGRGTSYLTLHAAAGLRARLGPDWGFRLEARFRTIDPFAGKSADLGVGISRTLRRRSPY